MMYLFLAAPAFLILGFMAWQYQQEKKRTETLHGVAETLGLSFSEKDEALLNRLRHFQLFAQGHTQKLRNVMSGTARGIEVTIFDYKYVTGGSKNTKRWLQSVILFRAEKNAFPYFVLRPENLFHKIGGVFGYRDIDFESHPSFSSKYLLRTRETEDQDWGEEQVRAWFNEQRLTFLEKKEPLSIEACGDHMIFYRSNQRYETLQARDFLQEGFEVYEAMKDG